MESILSVLLFVGFLSVMMRYGCGPHIHGGGCSHASHHRESRNEDGSGPRIVDQKMTARDPVCGMEIEIGESSRSVHYGSDTFYFCSDNCFRIFKERLTYFADKVRLENRNVA
jgi:YHS domain-containing protein